MSIPVEAPTQVCSSNFSRPEMTRGRLAFHVATQIALEELARPPGQGVLPEEATTLASYKRLRSVQRQRKKE